MHDIKRQKCLISIVKRLHEMNALMLIAFLAGLNSVLNASFSLNEFDQREVDFHMFSTNNKTSFANSI